MATQAKLDIVLNLIKKGTGAKDAEKELTGLDKAVQSAGAALTAMAVVHAAKATFELAELGAQSLRTKDAFRNISGGADEAALRLNAMKKATRGAIRRYSGAAAAQTSTMRPYDAPSR